MRKIILIAALSILLFSCSSNSPEKTAKFFWENIFKGKIKEAKKYATEPTGKLYEQIINIGGFPIDPDFKFIMTKDSIVKNRAWVTFKAPDGRNSTIELVKIDGNWLVHVDLKK